MSIESGASPRWHLQNGFSERYNIFFGRVGPTDGSMEDIDESSHLVDCFQDRTDCTVVS